MSPKRTRRATVLTGTALALVLAGCSSPQAETETVAPPVASDAAAESATEPTATAAADADEAETEAARGASAAADARTEPLAVIEGSPPYAAPELVDLRRIGETVTLEFVIETAPSDDISVDPRDDFAATVDQFGLGEDQSSALDRRRLAVSGVTLIHQANRKRHLVLRDSEGVCVCTSFEGNAEPGIRYRHSAQFPAPPADVDAMTVEVPLFPAVDGVRLRTVTP